MFQPTIKPMEARSLATQLMDVRSPQEYQHSGLAKRLLEACGFALAHSIGSYFELEEGR